VNPRTRWTEELERLEADAESLASGADAGAAWEPPADMPPLPPELLDRARAVLARQRAASEALLERRTRTGAEHRAVVTARVRSRPDPAAPAAFLDVTT
jgi:hypothetical protein